MTNPIQIERKNSKIKSAAQHRGGKFESAISFSAGKKRLAFRVHPELKRMVDQAAGKLNISVAEFVRRAIADGLPRIEKAVGLPRQ